MALSLTLPSSFVKFPIETTTALNIINHMTGWMAKNNRPARARILFHFCVNNKVELSNEGFDSNTALKQKKFSFRAILAKPSSRMIFRSQQERTSKIIMSKVSLFPKLHSNAPISLPLLLSRPS